MSGRGRWRLQQKDYASSRTLADVVGYTRGARRDRVNADDRPLH
jgi:hypothetical protein